MWSVVIAENVEAHTLASCGHFIPEERPEFVIGHILDLSAHVAAPFSPLHRAPVAVVDDRRGELAALVVLILCHQLKRFVPTGTGLLHISDQYTVRMFFELNIAGDSAFLKQNLGNSNPLRVPDLNDLSFHNYIVITFFRMSTDLCQAVEVLVQYFRQFDRTVGLLVILEDRDPCAADGQA